MEVYKVRHKTSGLFWKGDGVPSHVIRRWNNQDRYKDRALKQNYFDYLFNNSGKSWGNPQWVRNAVRGASTGSCFTGEHGRALNEIFSECEIVEFKITETKALEL